MSSSQTEQSLHPLTHFCPRCQPPAPPWGLYWSHTPSFLSPSAFPTIACRSGCPRHQSARFANRHARWPLPPAQGDQLPARPERPRGPEGNDGTPFVGDMLTNVQFFQKQCRTSEFGKRRLSSFRLYYDAEPTVGAPQ